MKTENTISIYDILGTNIRAFRKALGWSQATLAEKADISVPYMTMIELGQRSASLEVIQLIAQALSVPVSVLFETNKDISKSAEYDLKILEKTLQEKLAVMLNEELKKFHTALLQ